MRPPGLELGHPALSRVSAENQATHWESVSSPKFAIPSFSHSIVHDATKGSGTG